MKPLCTFRGEVMHGKHRGKLLGFPTANIRLHKKIPEGIYASHVQFRNKTYIAATFIGMAQTFEELDYKAECYLLDFEGDLYGSFLSVRLYSKLRENKKFDSRDALVLQISKDIADTKAYFTQQKPESV